MHVAGAESRQGQELCGLTPQCSLELLGHQLFVALAAHQQVQFGAGPDEVVDAKADVGPAAGS